MDAPMRPMKIMLSLVGAVIISLLVAAGLCWIGFVYAEVGHGTLLPYYWFFAPAWIASDVVDRIIDPYGVGSIFFVFAMFGLYAGYGLALAMGRYGRIGRVVLIAVLFFHYAAVVWLWRFPRSPYLGLFDELLKLVWKDGPVYSVIMVEFFVGAHVLAFQYAGSEMPYRPRLTKWVVGWLVMGFALGYGLYYVAGVWTM